MWFAGCAASFAVLERRALRGDYETLSAALRLWLGLHPPRVWRHVTAMAAVGGAAWLARHLATVPPGGPR